MTNVTYKIDGKHFDITIKGHAEFAEAGKDIVCSAISILVYTLINHLQKITDKVTYSIKEGDVHIYGYGKDAIACADMFRTGIDLLSKDYPKYIGVAYFFKNKSE